MNARRRLTGGSEAEALASFAEALIEEDVQAVRELLEAGLSTEAMAPRASRTLLLRAARVPGSAELIRLLVGYGADLRARDARGAGPIALAVEVEAPDNLEALLEMGAEVDERDSTGSTPLLGAVYHFRSTPSLVGILIAAGADPDAVNEIGLTPRLLDQKLRAGAFLDV